VSTRGIKLESKNKSNNIREEWGCEQKRKKKKKKKKKTKILRSRAPSRLKKQKGKVGKKKKKKRNRPGVKLCWIFKFWVCPKFGGRKKGEKVGGGRTGVWWGH